MEHVILVAFVIEADTQREAEMALHDVIPLRKLQQTHPQIDSWWVAMNERYDGSDNDTAVFVPGSGMRAWAEAQRRKRLSAWGHPGSDRTTEEVTGSQEVTGSAGSDPPPWTSRGRAESNPREESDDGPQE